MSDSYHIPFGRLHNGWLLLYHPHSQYGYLRLIDDRRTEQRLERAEIGNRKRTARYVVRHQLVDDPQQLALTTYPGDKAVQDAPSFKGKASSDRSNPRLAAASPFSMF